MPASKKRKTSLSILEHRVVRIHGYVKRRYVVEWADGSRTSEPASNLTNCQNLLTRFWSGRVREVETSSILAGMELDNRVKKLESVIRVQQAAIKQHAEDLEAFKEVKSKLFLDSALATMESLVGFDQKNGAIAVRTPACDDVLWVESSYLFPGTKKLIKTILPHFGLLERLVQENKTLRDGLKKSRSDLSTATDQTHQLATELMERIGSLQNEVNELKKPLDLSSFLGSPLPELVLSPKSANMP